MTEHPAKSLVPPNSKESEMMVLGTMLTSVNSLNAAADSLDAQDFYYTEHQIIFDVLKAAYKNDKQADVHLVCEELKRIGKLKTVGGVVYVTSLAQYAGTSAFIEEYAEVVKNKAILRRMIHTAHDIEKQAIGEPGDVHAFLDEAQQKLFTIGQSANSQGGVLIRDILSGVKATAKIPFLKELQQKQEEFSLKGPEDLAITGLPTHFLDLDKMINGLGPSNFIILAARPAMGKCVTGNTQIIDPETGALHSIKDLVSRGVGRVATLGKDWALRSASPSAFIADGIKPTFKLTTALGKEIEATAVHPLLTISGWKRLEELKVGERIAVPRSLPYFGEKNWPEHQLIALAYFIADGCLTETCPSFTNTNSKIVADFKRAISNFGPISIREEEMADKSRSYYGSLSQEPLHDLKRKFGEAVHALLSPRKKQLYQWVENLGLSKTIVCGWAHAMSMPSLSASALSQTDFPEQPSFSEAVRENPVTGWLKTLGLMGKDAHHKIIPPEIFELTKANIATFLNRLFSCEGTAYLTDCKGQPFPVIAYASVSKSLIDQIQHLLLRFGILSKIRRKQTKLSEKTFTAFELEIHGKDHLTRFCQEIGIFAKEEAVSKVLSHVSSASPGGAKTLEELSDVLDDVELKQIANSDVYWDTIVSIEPTGEKEVFDLTVEETHNFVAGDIIVHNTAFAVNIAENLCFKSGLPVGMFSLEMTAEQLLHRLICSQAEVESDKIRTGNLSGAEFQRIVAAVNSMQKATMVIDDQPGLKITDLRARARRMKETHGIQFLVIDYLQLISGSGVSRSAENRQNEISEISRMLKTLARELNIPILCLSQLSRKVEERPGHRPMMSDLRESGSLEQDSDVVVFLLRREYYDPYDKPGLAEVIVAKNRHGGVGSVFLTFRKELAQFANYSASLEVASKDDAFAAFTPS